MKTCVHPTNQLAPFVLAVLCLSAFVSNPAALAADGPKQAAAELLSELSSSEFETRVAASARLKALSPKELQSIVRLAVAAPSAEAVVRLLAEVDDRYTSSNTEDVAVASEALEMLTAGTRTLLSDGATRSLRQHWTQRIKIAIDKLESYGAIVRRGPLSPSGLVRPANRNIINVWIDDQWSGGEEGIRMFERFSSLIDSAYRGWGVVVFEIEGHPLTEAQHSALSEAVGHDRIQPRGRVALGIVGEQHRRPNMPDGVLIGSVKKNGSAGVAGILVGDFVVAIENSGSKDLKGEAKAAAEAAEKLQDFDDLVERLKTYDVGDVITVRLIRGIVSGNPTPMTLQVPLISWRQMLEAEGHEKQP